MALPHGLNERTRQSLDSAIKYAENIVQRDGHWYGELRSNATITAEYVFLRQALGLELSTDQDALCGWLQSQQQSDGSWSIAPDHPGDVSTTVEAYLALKILKIPVEHPTMTQARTFVVESGGVEKVRMFTRLYLATFGLFPWGALPELPAELIFVRTRPHRQSTDYVDESQIPAWAPINIYRFSSWARSAIVPLLIISHHKPVFPLPNGVSASNDFLDELWCRPEVKDVPYSMPLFWLWRSDSIAFCFAVIDRVLSYLKGLRWMFCRDWARKRCVEWILEHQEAEGDWAGIFQPMHFSLVALILENYTVKDELVCSGLRAIERFAWQDRDGKRIQASVSPVWDTVLMSIALCDADIPEKETRLIKAMEWVRSHQLLGPEGDWRIYSARTRAGGFSFEYFNRWYPDVDDTAAAVLAFLKHNPKCATARFVLVAVDWILGMQNKDGGWAAFDINNDKLFLNKISFSDMDALCDPSSADVTGRVLEAFGLLVGNESFTEAYVHESLWSEIKSSVRRAIAFLEAEQEVEGSWYGRWGSNYIYGTSNVLCGLVYWKNLPAAYKLISPAVEWMVKVQHEDGGWGESLETYRLPACAGIGKSTASQTAWALMALLAHLSPTNKAIERGIERLLQTQDHRADGGTTWPELQYTGTGFPGFFYIGYSLYPHYFPMMALGRYYKIHQQNQQMSEPLMI